MTYQLSDKDRVRLESFREVLGERQKSMLGYPISCRPPAADELKPFLDFVLNNLGDPFSGSNYTLNTFEYEREVIQDLAILYKLDPKQAWGYVTNGGSEGNFKGLSLGLEKFPDAVIYHSNKSHYSVAKAGRLMRAMTVEVATDRFHSICARDLAKKVFSDRPAIINLNYGTTMSGAVDSLDRVLDVLSCCGVDNTYLHVDAALSGLMFPFIPKSPKLDFELPIDSIAVSGHKFIGCPMPCGVIVCRGKGLQEEVEYINSVDSTVCGSRDGLAAIAWWCGIKGIDLQKTTEACLELTEYTYCVLRQIGWKCWKNPFVNTIVIARPTESLVKKWQLAVEGNWSHIILMPHIVKEDVDRFISDLSVNTQLLSA